MTEIVIPKALLRRPYNFETFLDIVPDEVPTLPCRLNGDLVVTFEANLDAATVTAIRDRMLTATADQEAERAAIRALIDADPSPLAQALARNWLGDE